MWRENCDVDLTYHVRPWRLPEPGGRRELDEAIGEIASTRWTAATRCGDVFRRRLADSRIAVVGKIHHALADGWRGESAGARHGPRAWAGQPGRYAPTGAVERDAGGLGIR